MQLLPTRRLFLTSQHNFLSCPACPEIIEVAYVWFKQVCHKENNAAEALQRAKVDTVGNFPLWAVIKIKHKGLCHTTLLLAALSSEKQSDGSAAYNYICA